jgi:anti-anti-sigma regulatory factor
VLVTPSAGLLFPAVDFVREAVSKAGAEDVDVVVLNCRHVTRADFTAAQGVQALLQDLRRQDKQVVFHNLRPSVAKILSPTEELRTSNSDTELEQVLRGRRGAEGLLKWPWKSVSLLSLATLEFVTLSGIILRAPDSVCCAFGSEQQF